jgi:hypothetical protein
MNQKQSQKQQQGGQSQNQGIEKDDEDGAIPGSDQDTGGAARQHEQTQPDTRQQDDRSRTGSDDERA